MTARSSTGQAAVGAIAFGDVDGDGLLDIVAAKQEGSVWIGDGEGFFTIADGNLPALPAFGVREGPSLGDIDADGLLDLAYCDATSGPRVFRTEGTLGQSTSTETRANHHPCD